MNLFWFCSNFLPLRIIRNIIMHLTWESHIIQTFLITYCISFPPYFPSHRGFVCFVFSYGNKTAKCVLLELKPDYSSCTNRNKKKIPSSLLTVNMVKTIMTSKNQNYCCYWTRWRIKHVWGLVSPITDKKLNTLELRYEKYECLFPRLHFLCL